MEVKRPQVFAEGRLNAVVCNTRPPVEPPRLTWLQRRGEQPFPFEEGLRCAAGESGFAAASPTGLVSYQLSLGPAERSFCAVCALPCEASLKIGGRRRAATETSRPPSSLATAEAANL